MTGADGVGYAEFWAVAESQGGAIANRQLRDRGLTAKEIKGLLRRRVLRPTPARGVYRVAGAERSWKQDLWVAVLAGPDGTLASHLSAAALRDLLSPPAMPHVTVPRWANGKFGGAVVHHATVDAADRGTWCGVEATALGRTIVDSAAVLTQGRLNSLVDAAFGKGLCTYRKVLEAWERAGRVKGGALIEAALAPYSGGAEPGSVKAAHVLRRIQEWGLPMPICEYEIRDAHGGFIAKVDFIWRPWRFILEYDGDEYHGPRRWGIDDRTQAAIEAEGFRLERADRFDLRPSSTRLRSLLSSVLLQPPRGAGTRSRHHDRSWYGPLAGPGHDRSCWGTRRMARRWSPRAARGRPATYRPTDACRRSDDRLAGAAAGHRCLAARGSSGPSAVRHAVRGRAAAARVRRRALAGRRGL